MDKHRELRQIQSIMGGLPLDEDREWTDEEYTSIGTIARLLVEWHSGEDFMDTPVTLEAVAGLFTTGK